MLCQQCKTENRVESRFCKNCGREVIGIMVTKRCPFCAEEILGDAVKCKYCGEWLPRVCPSFEEEDKEMKEFISYALDLTLKLGQVSSDILRADDKVGHKYALVLGHLEREGFVYKPEGSKTWKINFEKIRQYLNKK